MGVFLLVLPAGTLWHVAWWLGGMYLVALAGAIVGGYYGRRD